MCSSQVSTSEDILKQQILNNIDNKEISWDDILDTKVEIVNNEPSYYTQKTVDSSLDPKIDSEIIERNCQICLKCGNNLIKKQTLSICVNCGIEYDYENTTEDHLGKDCNVSDNGFVPFKYVGPGAYRAQRCLLSTTANHESYDRNHNLKKLINFDFQSKGGHVPKNIIRETNMMISEIKKHGYVFRKDHKKGVSGACLYYICYLNGIGRPPSEIARYLEIEERFLSYGDRVLRDLAEKGVIDIPMRILPIRQFAQIYMKLLGIENIEYENFVVDLVQRAEEIGIHMLYDSKNNTKCVGAIYMLIERMPHLREKITKDTIEKECKISKTTFLKYHKNLYMFPKKLKRIFKKYRIPMPLEWRNA
jgi:transcription initiation factor TFIIIB Brf1 subunit/transcription initiation factor TFIIB